jgi:hypothetical protein
MAKEIVIPKIHTSVAPHYHQTMEPNYVKNALMAVTSGAVAGATTLATPMADKLRKN